MISFEVSKVKLSCGFGQLFLGKTVSLSSAIPEHDTNLKHLQHYFNAALVSLNVFPQTINQLFMPPQAD